QYALAGLLVTMGRPQEALELYEQSLRTDQELGEVRGVAVTQNAMADVLSQLDRPQEALALYEQSLRSKQELGEVREVAVTQANFSLLLFEQREYRRALAMAWQAYISLNQRNYIPDAQAVQQILVSMKQSFAEQAHFDALWNEVIKEP